MLKEFIMKTMSPIGPIQPEALKELEKGSEEGRKYLNAGLDSYYKAKNVESFLVVLRTLIEAKGGLEEVAKKAQVDPELLTPVLTGKRKPNLIEIAVILRGSGYSLSLKKGEKASE